jgi:dehydrogenase/reductase SDR family protein 1
MGGPLSGRVALVAGASKNIGKGIALEVAAAGATTFITGRTLEDSPGALGSLRRTGAEIKEAGGEAIPVQCEHGDDKSVAAVFDQIDKTYGRLDLLVNVVSPDFSSMVGKPFWELPFEDISRCLWIGPRSNYVTTVLAARLMMPRREGLIVNISSHGAEQYLLSIPYGVGKAAIDRITRDTALELKPHGVAVVSRGQGASSDPYVIDRTGGSFRSSRLARDYGFTEDDGSLPPEIFTPDDYLAGQDLPDFWKGVERFTEDEAAVQGEQGR